MRGGVSEFMLTIDKFYLADNKKETFCIKSDPNYLSCVEPLSNKVTRLQGTWLGLEIQRFYNFRQIYLNTTYLHAVKEIKELVQKLHELSPELISPFCGFVK